MITRLGKAAKMPFSVHPHMLRHACGFKLANDGHDTRQNISGLPQGLAPPSGGKLIMRASVRAICQSRWSTMKQQAIEGRRDRAADIMDVGVYAIVILVVMLLWVYIPA
jgi:hypothetical protein